MFGWLKKGSRSRAGLSPAVAPVEQFWDQMGIGRLVPVYIQLHLAARCPGNQLKLRQDGGIDTDDVPAFMHENNPKSRAAFLQLMHDRLDPSMLPALPPAEIVSRLCDVYTQVTGQDMYAKVCNAWCVQKKLI